MNNNNNDIPNHIKENNISNLNIEENNINIKQKSSQYKCVLHYPLNTNDCVNSIDIFNNYIAFGTIMGDLIFCRLEEEKNINDNNKPNINTDINNANTNNCNNINKRDIIDLNKTDSNLSDNKDIILKDDNTKEIILNINHSKNFLTNNLINNNNEEKNRNDKNKLKCIKIKLNRNELAQTTDNYTSINIINNKEISNISKMDQKNNLINLDLPKTIKLIHGAIENICCVSLFNDILNFSVGDIELIHCEKISSFYGNDISMAHNFRRTEIYECEQSHCDFCENCSCLMSTNNFLIIYSYYSDFNWPLRINTIKYQNRNLKTNEVMSGFVEMSNYNIPFDFDGDHFLYIEYLDESTRCINILKTLTDEKIFKYLLDKKFGHISHMKLLPDNCIFLCRNIFVCEIYKYKKDNNEENFININKNDNNNNNNDNIFLLLNMWVHNYNKEIISSNVYILGNKISYEYKNNINYDKKEINRNSLIKKDYNKIFNKNEILHNLIHEIENNSSVDSSNSKNKILGYENKYKKNNIFNFENEEKNNKIEKEDKIEKIEKRLYKKGSLNINFNDSDNDIIQNKEKYYIITLDIEGNFNLYYNSEDNKGIKRTLFNLYKVINISQKNLNFFSVGFPYYITMNELYYIITTDKGVFVINKNK